MEQNNYLEFEKSKAAVYTIMEACFQDVFDLEDDELGSFHDEIDRIYEPESERQLASGKSDDYRPFL